MAATAALGYVLGSIPFGLVLTRLAGLGDIRTIGSGNIGATNVLRTGRKDLALATLLLDAGKAGLAFLAASAILTAAVRAPGSAGGAAGMPTAAFHGGLIAGASAFIGHCFPVWLNFKGGKGVATFIGLLLAAMWQVGLGFAAIWLAIAGVSRMSSLAALTGTLAAPVLAFWFYGPFACAMTSGVALLVYWRHRSNISRILAGTEPKIGAKGKSPP
ncbi:glycerol-3-phosphate 1-O-acyltransferase PlsY [bacterium]|nr:glycerol-3-phosphate 1-O-acyltransferase PlsY [bacterium]